MHDGVRSGTVVVMTAAVLLGACVERVDMARAADGPSVRWGGYVQARETLRPGSGLTATLNRARLNADIHIDSTFSARVSGEFAASVSGGGSAVQLRDAYLRGAWGHWSVQAGQYKTPMSREFLMSLSAVETPDRAAVIDTLATKRDIGVQVGYAFERTFDATIGVFNGEGQNVLTNRDSTVLVVGRVTTEPVSGVGFGVSGVSFGGDSTRAGVDLEVKLGGAHFRGEYLWQDAEDGFGDQEGWYGLLGYQVFPAWSLYARREDLLRPTLQESRSRYRATTLGVMWEPPGGRVRGLLDWVERSAGQAPEISHQWIAQLQGKF